MSAKTGCHFICNCENSMPLDKRALSEALERDVDTIYNNLCRSQLVSFEKALRTDDPFTVACAQEAPLFQEVAEEAGKDHQVRFINIRETSGWSKDAKKATPKIAALFKSADFEATPARLKSIKSDGMCLVYGAGQEAFETAKLLAEKLSVTLLLSADEDLVLSNIADVPIYRGDIAKAEGSFGAFSLVVNTYAPLMPSARGQLDFVMARDGATTKCSLILDMSGNAPLFSGHTHRDGYFKVDPKDPAAALRAVIKLSDMVGEFEKPIYVDYNADSCAHSRSQKAGCNKCLDACPAGAIADMGDTVEIDAGICGGCGSCHSVCPTGSISYQYPQRADIIGKAQSILSAYGSAGGKQPILLIHDEPFGADLIGALARYGDGLPANVIPMSMHAVTTLGHVEMAAMLASGATQVVILCDPQNAEELSALRQEIELCEVVVAGLGLEVGAISEICETDPNIVEEALWSLGKRKGVKVSSFMATGSKRDIARLSFSKLHDKSPARPEIVKLPANSPYGVVEIDQSACTLCMACTSACPTSAIMDTPGEPRLRFVESACVQCGLCVNTCPETALSLKPQLNFAPSVMQPQTLYEEEPFCCIACGTPFATKSTIERISKQLAGKHSMFANDERSRLIEMCEACRVEEQANSADDPFSVGTRARVRTTQDYVNAEAEGLTADDFLMDD